MKFAIATKKEMTQKFAADGSVVPVTKLIVEPATVTQIKKSDKDGYFAIQISSGQKRKLAKPLKGHFKGLGSFRQTKEFRLKTEQDTKLVDSLKVGDKITVSLFQSGDRIQVTGISKGRGFQGVVRRHGFHGSPASHGHKDQLRMPGSIGSTGPAHVFKGTRMAGQMGNAQVTVKNLTIVEVEPENNILYVKGAVPGANGGLIFVSGVGEFKLVASVEKPEEKATKEAAVEAVDLEAEKLVEPEKPVAESKAETKPEEKTEDKEKK